MQIIRTIFWALLTGLLVAFIFMNQTLAHVRILPIDTTYLVFDWPVGVIALVFYLLGITPTLLLAKATQWRLKRRIASLENAMRLMAPATPATPDTAEDHADTPANS